MKSLTRGKMWCYAIGQLGWSIISGLIGSWLVYFYQPNQQAIDEGMKLFVPQGRVVFGVLTILGLITAFGRIFDGITDPLVGSWSDKCKHKLGRRIPFMKYAAIPFGLTFVLVFCCPVNHVSVVNSIWLFAFITFYYFSITCYCTPYTSLLAELAHTQEEKLKLSTCISLTFIVGTAIGYLGPVIWGIFINNGMERIPAMRITFAILAVIAVIFMFVPVFTIKEKDYCDAKPVETSMLSSLGKTFKNRDFRIFVSQDVIYFFGLTMFQTGLPFFVTSLLQFPEQYATYMFVGLTAISLLYYPFITKLATKFGKKKLVVTAFILFFITFGFTGICGPKLNIPTIVQAIFIVVFGGLPMALFGILPQAIVADIAQSDSVITGENRSGMFYAARTFAMKFGQCFAMLAFTSLATVKHVNDGDFGYRLVAIVSAVCCAVGAILMALYNEKRVYSIINQDK